MDITDNRITKVVNSRVATDNNLHITKLKGVQKMDVLSYLTKKPKRSETNTTINNKIIDPNLSSISKFISDSKIFKSDDSENNLEESLLFPSDTKDNNFEIKSNQSVDLGHSIHIDKDDLILDMSSVNDINIPSSYTFEDVVLREPSEDEKQPRYIELINLRQRYMSKLSLMEHEIRGICREDYDVLLKQCRGYLNVRVM
jgi:hypothetical protein